MLCSLSHVKLYSIFLSLSGPIPFSPLAPSGQVFEVLYCLETMEIIKNWMQKDAAKRGRKLISLFFPSPSHSIQKVCPHVSCAEEIFQADDFAVYVTFSSATPNDDINHIIACISSERKTFLFWLFQLYEIAPRSPTRFIRSMCNTFFANICCVHFLIRNFTFCWNLTRLLLALHHHDDDDAQHAVWCFNWTLFRRINSQHFFCPPSAAVRSGGE